MSSVRVEMNPGAIEALLNGPESIALRKRQAEGIRRAWIGNIHRITGDTDSSIKVEVNGKEVIVRADTSDNPNSAWFFLEFGTSSMRAQHPGARAIRSS